ncbi:MAG: threonylcarbamoyl-AMP synthase, partial [Candidatus Heimdallarchaeota archaeon]|nr:threonylcarbamoyl-AMP synthase [Candidatus Heimdallarchaeota archaeon]MCK4290048.1 threonylcarbamoyl-AMP synthase [Candidatus Heimdallarchaeota archaeon]
MIIKVDIRKPKKETINKAVEILEKGGIIVYPTETAYGLGCDSFNIQAIKKIFEIKTRPSDQPLSVIVDSLEMIEKIAFMQENAKLLIEKFYPGPLVIALKKKSLIPDVLNKNRIAFRISNNEFVQNIVRKLGKPIVSTSANQTGYKSPYSIDAVLETITEKDVDLIFDAGLLEKNKPSTIIDFVMESSPQIIRVGAISAKEIFQTLKIKEE